MGRGKLFLFVCRERSKNYGVGRGSYIDWIMCTLYKQQVSTLRQSHPLLPPVIAILNTNGSISTPPVSSAYTLDLCAWPERDEDGGDQHSDGHGLREPTPEPMPSTWDARSEGCEEEVPKEMKRLFCEHALDGRSVRDPG